MNKRQRKKLAKKLSKRSLWGRSTLENMWRDMTASPYYGRIYADQFISAPIYTGLSRRHIISFDSIPSSDLPVYDNDMVLAEYRTAVGRFISSVPMSTFADVSISCSVADSAFNWDCSRTYDGPPSDPYEN